jgi:WD40 repeat protein
LSRSLYKNGKPFSEGRYEHGIQVGTWRKYDRDGNEERVDHPERPTRSFPRKDISIEMSKDIAALEVSPDGKTLAIGYLDGSVDMWDIASQMRRFYLGPAFDRTEIAYRNPLRATQLSEIEFSPDGKLLGMAKGCSLFIFDASTGEQKTELWWGHGGVYGKVNSLAWLPDSSGIVTGGSNGIVVWDLDSKQVAGQFVFDHAADVPVLRDSEVQHVAVDNSARFAFVSGQTFATAWDLQAETEHKPLRTKLKRRSSFLIPPKGNHLLAITDDQIVRFDIATGDEAGLASHDGVSVVSQTLGGDRRAAVGGGRTLVVHDLAESDKIVRTVEDTGSTITAVAMSRDGKLVVTAHRDKNLRFWVLEPIKP